MSNVFQLDKRTLTVEQALDKAKEQSHVIVIGITDFKVLVSASGQPSIFEMIGLLERAKAFLVEESKCICGE